MYQSYMLILIHVSIIYVDINTCINHIFVMQTVQFYTATCTKCIFANSKILL